MIRYRAFYCFFMCFFGTFSLAAGSARADVLREFVDSAAGISFTYPPSLHETPLPPGSTALVLLEAEGRKYPTLNVLVEPGDYQVETRSLADQVSRVLQSYKSVGISDAAAVESGIRSVSGRPSFHALLRYSYQEKPVVSGVTIIPGNDRHFIVTYIDEESRHEGSKAFEETVLSSFTITDQPDPGRTQGSLAPLTAIIVCLLLILFLALRIRASRTHP